MTTNRWHAAVRDIVFTLLPERIGSRSKMKGDMADGIDEGTQQWPNYRSLAR